MTPIFIRIAVVAVALFIWYRTQTFIGNHSIKDAGIQDGVHRLTARLHGYFSSHEKSANLALIISSLFIDLIGISLIVISIIGQTFAPFLGILIVFSMRQISQLCCPLPPPPGIIWRSPGVPTVLVTYGVGNDFFFSGHTALAVLGAIEIYHSGPWWLGAIAIAVAIGEALIVLILRAHYTMDVIAGALAAWFAADMAARLAPWVDEVLKRF